MTVKLRHLTRAACAATMLLLAACEAEPLSPSEATRLERIFGEMHEQRAVGVVQNLRYAGLYEGPLSRQWSAQLAQAINQAHFDLDFVDEQYNFETDAGMANFLNDLSYASIRPRLASELSVDPPAFEQTLPPDQTAVVLDGRCVASGGSYRRGGEQLHMDFWARGRDAGIDISWDGWPGGQLPMIATLRSGERWVPLPTEHERNFPVSEISMFQVNNGGWITSAIKHSNKVVLDLGETVGEFSLPTGDMYRTGMALESCANTEIGT